MDRYTSSEHVASVRTPATPVLCHRPHAATRAARWFVDEFPGHVFYAVKANPEPLILSALAAGGIDRFDVASLSEVRAVRAQFPGITLAFMNPVKAPEAIAEAYHDHGVRIFSLDSEAELDKILRATGQASDLTLAVRVGVDNTDAMLPLGRKFGARGPQVPALVRAARIAAERLGVCFHVGSQSLTPDAYTAALGLAEDIVRQSGVFVDILDVGGGFPAPYPGIDPAPMAEFFAVIADRFDSFMKSGRTELWCEPGRALVAEAASLIVRVEHRRDFDLFLNDGVYGALYDAGHLGWRYPARAVGNGGAHEAPYRFYGPTCDDADHMPGPFHLPHDIAAGDLIEVGQLGAYGRTMAGRFNGYGDYQEVVCTDDPFGTVYQQSQPIAQFKGGTR